MKNFIDNTGGFTNVKVSEMDSYDPNMPNREGVVWNTEKIDKLLGDYGEGTVDIRGYKNSPFFGNDINLRRANLLFEYTQDEMNELRKCAADPIYFGEKYAKVLTDDGLININFRDYQLEMMEGYINHRFSILLASRQVGKTITSAIYLVWYLMFHYEKNALIVADIADTTKEIIDKIKNIIYNLPFYMRPGIKINNVMSMKFDNDCRIIGRSTTKKTGIGLTINLLYMDEFAHIADSYLNYFYRSVYPTISGLRESKIIISSTPHGLNRFHDIWVSAIEGENEYYPMRVDWWQVEGRDEEWKRVTIANLGSEEDFNQEYGLQFFSTDDLLLNSIDLEKIYNIRTKFKARQIDAMNVDKVIFKEGGVVETKPTNYSKFLKWHESFLDKTFSDDNSDLKHSKDYYVFSIDSADGVGQNYSVVNIFKVQHLPLKYLFMHRPSIHNEYDVFSLIQVGYFRTNTLNIDTFSNVIIALVFDIFNYENVRISLELNHKGELIKERLEKHGNYWAGMLLHSKHTDSAKFFMPGLILNSNKKKVEYCDKFQHLLSIDKIIPTEYITVTELGGFGKNKTGTSYRCQTGNDDMAISSINAVSFFDSPQFWEICDELYDKIDDDEYLKRFENDILNYTRSRETSDDNYDLGYLRELNQ